MNIKPINRLFLNVAINEFNLFALFIIRSKANINFAIARAGIFYFL